MRRKHKAFLAGLAVCLVSVQGLATPVLRFISAGAQAPSSINPGETATYPVIVAKSGIGSLNKYLTVSGLPAGATASFYPSVVSFSEVSPPVRQATLTIVTSASTEPGTYPLTLSARHGNSKTVVTGTATLVIGGSPRVALRPLLSIEPVSDGMRIKVASAPGQLCYIEATTDLGSGLWTRIGTNSTDALGVFYLIDTDVGTYSSRFYRSMTPGN